MILTKDMISKNMRKGRTAAVQLLNRISRIGGLPEPIYEHKAGGVAKYRSHYYKVFFRIPAFIMDDADYDHFQTSIFASGRDKQKGYARSLAALEAVLQLEECLNVARGGLLAKVEKYEKEQEEKQKVMQSVPVDREVPGVSWENLPIDMAFRETDPAGRRGCLEFSPDLREDPQALAGAKAFTLCSTNKLPEIKIHANQTDDPNKLQLWANIHNSGRAKIVSGPKGEMSWGITKREAEILALIKGYEKFEKVARHFVRDTDASFGMAKLFVKLPEYQFKDLNDLLYQVQPFEHKIEKDRRSTLLKRNTVISQEEDKAKLKSRLSSFRAHQKKLKLPVDAVESKIPHDATITIVRGGTGSGKTTRYPLMLSLLSPSGPSTKVVVAQPRRLACQTAARRVAFEQDTEIGSAGSPIGYSIRFESFPASAGSRTVDFQTPGILLRRAMNDPLLQQITHLCIDEVHERNADMDLLLALAKDALRKRATHPTLPPLKIILMSATLDSSHWESYFSDGNADDSKTIAVVDVPDVRRFPIDTVFLGESNFPMHLRPMQSILSRNRAGYEADDHDEAICEAMATLAIHLVKRNELDGGSILCFLPGLEEIRLVDRIIQGRLQGEQQPTVAYLHSSLSSQEQAKVFNPGPKVVLSTNLAETSVTIPDVKVVIDSGRERQFSLLDSSSSSSSSSNSDTTTVVGSQLTTVNISRASAKQRAGRAGRVSAGVCYRLYTNDVFDKRFTEFTKPEMLRMDLSQLALQSLSLYTPESGSPLQLLLDAPDPPTASQLRQTLRGMSYQGLAEYDPDAEEKTSLTPMGRAASVLPASPRIGRMLMMGLVLRSISPALKIAALLSVPKVLTSSPRSSKQSQSEESGPKHSSDLVKMLETYEAFLNKSDREKARDPRLGKFRQVYRVEQQLEKAMRTFLHNANSDEDWAAWNSNSHRVGALLGLICGATPHVAHLVNGKMDFATRDVAGNARIHPASVNGGPDRRVHWYLYHELRTTSAPYLHVTTAASPLELALFSEASVVGSRADGGPHYAHYVLQKDEARFIVDQWVPVNVSVESQGESFMYLRRLLTNDLLQQVSLDPKSVLTNPVYERIVLFVLSALELQRLRK